MKLEFSAGGVVLKREDESLKILLCQHSQHHGWVFPKGIIGDSIEKESKEETALREVKEECGVDGRILESLDPVVYWYHFEGEKRKKTVYYYLMEYIDGDINIHDDEMENVEWLDFADVENRLTYPSDKKVWEEAKSQIVNNYGVTAHA